MTPALAALLATVLIAGCASVETGGADAQGYKWVKDGATGKPVVHVISDGNVFLHCGDELHALSCSRIESGICDIYLPDDAQPWQEPHERRHCEGWRHPNPLRDGLDN